MALDGDEFGGALDPIEVEARITVTFKAPAFVVQTIVQRITRTLPFTSSLEAHFEEVRACSSSS